jgi:lipoprotein-anchoring transpeptidase ErfK/SrfK
MVLPAGMRDTYMSTKAAVRRPWPSLPLLGPFASAAALLLLAAPAPGPARAPSAAAKAAPRLSAVPLEDPAPASAAVSTAPSAQRPALLAIHRWLTPGEFAWDDDGVPAGPLTVVVDLRARTLSAYRAGVEIGRSFITHGADNKPTPTGTFPILQKDRDHVSNLYDAPMPFMLRLTWDGVAIHGGEIGDAVATRGCIGLPGEFAELLFAAAKVGDQVRIVTGPPPGAPYTAYAALPVQPALPGR